MFIFKTAKKTFVSHDSKKIKIFYQRLGFAIFLLIAKKNLKSKFGLV